MLSVVFQLPKLSSRFALVFSFQNARGMPVCVMALKSLRPILLTKIHTTPYILSETHFIFIKKETLKSVWEHLPWDRDFSSQSCVLTLGENQLWFGLSSPSLVCCGPYSHQL